MQITNQGASFAASEAATIANAGAAELVDALDMVETEHGESYGVDLGSIGGEWTERAWDQTSRQFVEWHHPEDVSRFDQRRATIAEASAGWSVRCHTMASNGTSARRYYIAERAMSLSAVHPSH